MSQTEEVKDYLQASGAIPNLDSKDDVLGAPQSDVKQKTNAKKAFVLLIILGAFVILIFGVIWFVKSRTSSSVIDEAPKEKTGIASKNVAMDSDLIEKAKLELKAKEAFQQKEKENAEAAAALKAEADMLKAAKESKAQGGKASTANASKPATSATNDPKAQHKTEEMREQTPHERRLAGSVLVNYGHTNNDTASTPIANNQSTYNAMQGTAKPANRDNGGIADNLQPSVLVSRTAGKLASLDFLLKRGTSIPCALETGIDTTLAGFVVCKVTNDVYSANSKTLLIERGASIFGEQQSSLRQGQERTFVLWTRIDNPSGITADLDSPATDQMGYNGIAGYVDTYFWKRFGGAIMMSFIKDFSANLNKNGENNMQNTSQSSADLATETLKNAINIAPTLRVLPATVVYVLVARDINFSSVYSLEKP